MALITRAYADREKIRDFLRQALDFAWNVHDSGSLEWPENYLAYVQWAGFPDGEVLIECSSAQHMGYEHTAAQLHALRALGFQDPDDEVPNHYVRITAHSDLEGAADALVAVLFDILRRPATQKPAASSVPQFLPPVPTPVPQPAAPNVGIDVPCVLLRIGPLWHADISDDELYEAVRGWWVLGTQREQATYALAVAKRVVRGAFKIHGWQSRSRHRKLQWAFDGEPAHELSALIGRDVSALFPLGVLKGVHYLNCDASA